MNLRVSIIAGAVVVATILIVLFVSCRRVTSGPDAPRGQVEESSEELFVELNPETKGFLLEDWRWKVGYDAEIFRVTVFGDLFIRDSNGWIFWLDTGSGRYSEVAKDSEQWAKEIQAQGDQWFHRAALQELSSRGTGLAKGQVYSWRQSPMLGGPESADNVEIVSLEVHVSNAGRLAEALKDVPPGTRIDAVDFDVLGPEGWEPTIVSGVDVTVYEIVVKGEQEYSIWPAGWQPAQGWQMTGKQGTKRECVGYLSELWAEMDALSLQEGPDGR